jgi:hypothetical protein
MSRNRLKTDLLWRQVNPRFLSAEGPNSQAFVPMPKDMGKLSVDDATLATAAESFVHFTRNLGFKSAGTWAVSVEEVESQKLVIEENPVQDLETPTRTNLAHCLIDFAMVSTSTGFARDGQGAKGDQKPSTKGERKRIAQMLAAQATARGCQHQATLNESE